MCGISKVKSRRDMRVISLPRIVLCSCFVAAVASIAHADPAWVQVRESAIRAKPVYYSPGVATIRYGEQLDRLSTEGSWARVRTKTGEGFVPVSSISRDRIVLSVKDISKVGADSADVVLAGKGFSREVEQSYKKENPSLRFDRVDQVERQARASISEVQSFRTSGGLR